MWVRLLIFNINSVLVFQSTRHRLLLYQHTLPATVTNHTIHVPSLGDVFVRNDQNNE